MHRLYKCTEYGGREYLDAELSVECYASSSKWYNPMAEQISQFARLLGWLFQRGHLQFGQFRVLFCFPKLELQHADRVHCDFGAAYADAARLFLLDCLRILRRPLSRAQEKRLEVV